MVANLGGAGGPDRMDVDCPRSPESCFLKLNFLNVHRGFFSFP